MLRNSVRAMMNMRETCCRSKAGYSIIYKPVCASMLIWGTEQPAACRCFLCLYFATMWARCPMVLPQAVDTSASLQWMFCFISLWKRTQVIVIIVLKIKQHAVIRIYRLFFSLEYLKSNILDRCNYDKFKYGNKEFNERKLYVALTSINFRSFEHVVNHIEFNLREQLQVIYLIMK